MFLTPNGGFPIRRRQELRGRQATMMQVEAAMATISTVQTRKARITFKRLIRGKRKTWKSGPAIRRS